MLALLEQLRVSAESKELTTGKEWPFKRKVQLDRSEVSKLSPLFTFCWKPTLFCFLKMLSEDCFSLILFFTISIDSVENLEQWGGYKMDFTSLETNYCWYFGILSILLCIAEKRMPQSDTAQSSTPVITTRNYHKTGRNVGEEEYLCLDSW